MGIISNLLFGDNSNNVSYKDAAVQKAYSQITADTYDKQYGGMTDYLNQNYTGGAGAYKTNLLTGLEKNAKDSAAQYRATKNNYFGNGFIGSLLNPIVQTASGIGDLAGLALSGGKANAWDGSNDYIGDKRDIGSDLGALGESLLTIIPFGKTASLAKAGKAVNAAKAAGTVIEPGTKLAKQAALLAKSQVPKTIGQKMAGGTLMGAGFGATGSLRDMGFENFDPGQFALSTAIGGVVGGGLAGLGGLWNKYTQPPTGNSIVPYSGANANSGEYQNALNILKENGIDTSTPETLKTTFRKFSIANHPDKGGSAELFAKVNKAKTTYQSLLDGAGKAGANPAPVVMPKQSFSQKLSNLKTNLGNTKAGTKISSLLKTKKGKVLAGAGGGLLLAQLLKSKGQNVNTMSDEELQELYNYIYGGGQ